MITTANTHATMNRLQQKKTFLGTSPSFIAYNQTYNIASQITALMTAEGTSSFTYDNDGQILTVSAGAMTSSESYSFDASGNRNSAGYTTGTDNQMTSAPNLAATTSHYEFAYDHEGNTTDRWTKTGTASTEHVVYTWDFRNRLAEVQTYTVSGASSTLVQTIDFGYDAFDHRTRETVTNNTASSVIFDQRFIYDGTNIAAAVDATTLTIQQAFLHGLAQNEFYAQDNVGTSSTMTLWAITDHQGTVRDVLSSAGSVINHVIYSSFGEILSQSNAGNATLLLYTSQIYDQYTGLFYYNARWYDARFGKFESIDPIGFGSGKVNLYPYCGNGSINKVDVSGEEDYPADWKKDYISLDKELVLVDGQYLDATPGQLFVRMQADGYIPGSGVSIRLISCAAGAPGPEGEVPLAQQLANIAGANVNANPFAININPHGGVDTIHPTTGVTGDITISFSPAPQQ